MISVKELCVSYGREKVLDGFSMEVKKGKFTVLLGVNGAGKSTLIKALLGMVPILSGQVIIDGSPLKEIKAKDLAKRTAYLCQERAVPDMTVEQLVLHGRFPYLGASLRYGAEDRSAAEKAMKLLGMDSSAQKKLSTLSGGMRQNAYLAMALAKEADLILLDEPTGHLDIAHRVSLMKKLCRLTEEGKTVFAVMHDLELALSFADFVTVLNEGKNAFCGTPREFAQNNISYTVFGIETHRNGDSFFYKYK